MSATDKATTVETPIKNTTAQKVSLRRAFTRALAGNVFYTGC